MRVGVSYINFSLEHAFSAELIPTLRGEQWQKKKKKKNPHYFLTYKAQKYST